MKYRILIVEDNIMLDHACRATEKKVGKIRL